MTTDAEMLALADRYCDSIESGDVDALRDCYALEAKIWHNSDGLDQSRDDNVEATRQFAKRLTDRKIAGRRVHVFAGGFVHQHELQGTRADGARARLALCIVFAVKDGKITRRDEYFDSAQLAQFL